MFLPRRTPAVLILAVCCAACGVATAPANAGATLVASQQPVSTATTAPARTLTPQSSAVPPTPLPVPRDFSEPFSSSPAYWHFLQVDNSQPYAAPVVQDGFLVFTLSTATQWAYGLYSGAHYTDVRIEAEIQSRTTGDGSAGVVCRYDEKKGWYEFNIFEDQTYQLLFGQWLAPGVARYTPLYQGKSQAIDSETNRIGLLCGGTTLEPFINGAPMRAWPELRFGLQQGEVGLSAASFADAPFIIAVDWAAVSEP